MKSETVAWWFVTPKPMLFTKVQEALRPLGIRWTLRDSDYKRDSIIGQLTSHSWARIYEIGLRGYRVNLTVETAKDEDFEAELVTATKKLLGEVLPLLEAREVKESAPQED